MAARLAPRTTVLRRLPILRGSNLRRCAPINIDTPDGTDNIRSYAIAFRPKPEMLKKANEPLYILRELRKLGELDLVAETDELPSLSDLEFDRPYIGWTGTLRTTATRAQIDEIFEFVVGDCELDDRGIGPLRIPRARAKAARPTRHGGSHSCLCRTTYRVQKSESSTNPGKANEPPAPAAGAKAPVAKTGATTTRIDLERIDRVVNMVGELVIAQAMLGQIVQDLPEGVSGRLLQILEEVIHHTRELKDSVMSMRAQPVGVGVPAHAAACP